MFQRCDIKGLWSRLRVGLNIFHVWFSGAVDRVEGVSKPSAGRCSGWERKRRGQGSIMTQRWKNYSLLWKLNRISFNIGQNIHTSFTLKEKLWRDTATFSSKSWWVKLFEPLGATWIGYSLMLVTKRNSSDLGQAAPAFMQIKSCGVRPFFTDQSCSVKNHLRMLKIRFNKSWFLLC